MSAMQQSTDDERDMERRLLAVTMFHLRKFSNAELAAFGMATISGCLVNQANIAYKPCLDAALIKQDGSIQALEETKRALARVTHDRMKAGTFVANSTQGETS